MSELARKNISRQVPTSPDGKGAGVEKPGARYCAFCGSDANLHGLAVERFGEVFCSDGHAEEFVKEVRAARVQGVATALSIPPSTTEVERAEGPAAGAPKQRDWKRYLKLGACCGLPLLALVFLVGGGGAVLGAAGGLLPLLVALACPLGMYFMMRSMTKMEQKGDTDDKREDKSSGH